MSHSYNGWPASPDPSDIDVKNLVVDGVSFVGGVRAGDVHTVLGYVARQFDLHVENLVNPGCWGWSYRRNRNADNLSCHSSGTAIDCNAPQHPNGKDASQTFSRRQIDAIHRILGSVPELGSTVHWGGDWHYSGGLTPDPMHFEIHDHDVAKLHRVAERIKTLEEDVTPQDIDKIAKAAADRVLHAIGVTNKNPDGDKTGERSLAQTITDVEKTQDKQGQKITEILRKLGGN